jgi:hypothetical protein
MDTPESFISPARSSLKRFARELRQLEGLVRSLEGRLGGMERVDRDDERIRRVIAGAAVLARRASDAGTLTARELETESRGARPLTGTDLVAYRDPRKPDRTDRALHWISVTGLATLGLAGAGAIPVTVGAVAGAVGLIAARIAESPRRNR